jgi:phosphate transport system substrate-binding protein
MRPFYREARNKPGTSKKEEQQHMDDPNRVTRNGRFQWIAAGMLVLALSAFALVACDDDEDDGDGGGETPSATEDGGGDDLSGTIDSDGSSTVFPIMEAVAEEFGNLHSGVNVVVAASGTGAGFEKFCAGETDTSNASRAIEEDEIALCEAAGITYVEFEIGYDGISNVVNPAVDFIPNDCVTVAQLKTIWQPAAEGTVTSWSDVDPSFPDTPLGLYGPGTDSGTFDYFTEQINGEEGASRGDYTPSEDDNILVQGVAGDDGGLGYFGYAYYANNQDQLTVLAVDNGAGCVVPSPETIRDASYAPLTRPLYIYVTTEALARPEVAEMMRFIMTDGIPLIAEAGYVELDDYSEGLAQIP